MEAKRICLRCDKKFLSQGPQNRICPACTRNQPKVHAKSIGSLPRRKGKADAAI